MAQVIGRLTHDAAVKTLEGGKELVEFSIAENFRYKTKDGQTKDTVTFFNCVIWNRTKLAPHLKKGIAVILNGQLKAEGFKNKKNKQIKAAIKFNVHKLDFLPTSKTSKTETGEPVEAPNDDLPF